MRANMSKNGLIKDAKRLHERLRAKSIHLMTINVAIDVHEKATQAIEDASWIHEFIIAPERTRGEILKGLGMLRDAFRTIRDL